MSLISRLLLITCAAALSLSAQGNAVSYAYDEAGRLVSVTYPNGVVTSYAWDANGNLVRKQTLQPSSSTPQPKFPIGGVVNAASSLGTFGNAVSPGEIVDIYGQNIGPQAITYSLLTASNNFDSIAAGTTVTFDGTAATLLYSLIGQIGVIVPYSVAGQSSTTIVVTYQGVASPPVTVPVVAVAPGLFSADFTGTHNGAANNQDGTGNSPANPAPHGSVISLFGTGEGQTNPAGVNGKLAVAPYPAPLLPYSVTLGGKDVTANVQYFGGAPGETAGLFQLNLLIPSDAATGPVPIVVTIGGVQSQAGLFVSIK